MSESTNSALKVTSAAEWRKLRKEGFDVEFPTGRIARLRPATLENLLSAGKVPDFLTQIVAKMVQTGEYMPAPDENIVQIAAEVNKLNKILLQEIFLYPKIVDDPVADDEIEFEDITKIEREWAIAWAQAPQLSLANFREESQSNLEPARNSENV